MRYKKIFMVKIVNCWNRLPRNMMDIPSLNIQGCAECPGLAEAVLVYWREEWPSKIPASPSFSMILCFYNTQSENTFHTGEKSKRFYKWKVTSWQQELWHTCRHSSPVLYQVFLLSSSMSSGVLIEILIYWNFRHLGEASERRGRVGTCLKLCFSYFC